jgi:hypothetical protein
MHIRVKLNFAKLAIISIVYFYKLLFVVCYGFTREEIPEIEGMVT